MTRFVAVHVNLAKPERSQNAFLQMRTCSREHIIENMFVPYPSCPRSISILLLLHYSFCFRSDRVRKRVPC